MYAQSQLDFNRQLVELGPNDLCRCPNLHVAPQRCSGPIVLPTNNLLL
jgi:hypothetical protein